MKITVINNISVTLQIGFNTNLLVDNGETIISKASRICKDYEGKGVYKFLDTYKSAWAKSKGVRYKRITMSDTNPHSIRRSFRSKNKLMETMVLINTSRPGYSKLTTSLVNVSLKFQTLISHKYQYFLLKKCEKLLHCMQKLLSIFSAKNISMFCYKVVKHLIS